MICIVCVNEMIFAQIPSFGKHYSPQAFGNTQQVWGAAQDSSGFLYFIYNQGFVVFDGVKWQNYHIGEGGRGISISSSKSGSTFIHGESDFGVLAPDSINGISLDSIFERYYDVAKDDVPIHLNTFEIDGNTYFVGYTGIWVIGNEEFYIPSRNGELGRSFIFNETIYISQKESGLLKLIGDTLHEVEGSDIFVDDALIFSFQAEKNLLLLGWNRGLLYTYNGANFEKVSSPVDSLFASGSLSSGVKIRDDLYAISTYNKGVYFINNKYELVKKFDTTTGLFSDKVSDLFLDHEGTLWISMYLGGGGVQSLSTYPGNVFLKDYKIEHIVRNIEVIDDKILVSTEKGVFLYKVLPNANLSNQYSSSEIASIASTDSLFFVFTDSAISTIRESKKSDYVRFPEASSYKKVKRSVQHDNITFVSNREIIKIKKERLERTSIDLDILVNDALEDEDKIYLLNSNRGVFLYKEGIFTAIPIENDKEVKITYNVIEKVDGKIFIGVHGAQGASGLYELSGDSLFVRSNFLQGHDLDLLTKQVFLIEECTHTGDIWFYNNLRIKRAKKTSTGYELVELPYKLIGEGDEFYDIECTKNGVWFGGVNGLYFLEDPDKEYKTEFKTNITGILINNDSLIYGGYGEPMKSIVVSYEHNDLRFTYAAASYIAPDRNTYQYKLEGYDQEWSDWSSETYKEYTNLREGAYTFMVRSRNVYTIEGQIDIIPFIIRPPWYRTFLAYITYAILIVSFLYIIYKIRLNQILKVHRIRNRIAGDLHDDISGTLVGISNFAGAVQDAKDEQARMRYIDLIKESADETKEKITDIVWTINPEHDDWVSFLAKCKRYASDIFESAGIEYELNMIQDIPKKLEMEKRQNIWMIFRELITNIVRHSNATGAKITLQREDKYLLLKVSDNGKGFNTENGSRGNGINNIFKRAKWIKAKANVDSNDKSGTTWEIKIPI